MSQIVAGLDIGTTKVACIVGRKNEHGKIEILSMGKAESLGVSRGVVSNIEKTVEAIKEAVSKAEENAGGQLSIKLVNVGIAGQHISSRQERGILTREHSEEEISQKDIDMLLENMYRLALPPGEEIIHILPQDYIIDNQNATKDPIGMSGVRIEGNFHVITGQISAGRNINRCVSRADLEMDTMMLEPIASAEAVLTDEEKEEGVVLVDIGGGTTDIAIFHEGTIWHSAVIPFGGNIITEDIREGCRIMRRYAEKVKVQYGSALESENKAYEIVSIPGLKGRPPKEISLKNLAAIIQARMTEIIELVNYQIVNSGYAHKLNGGLVVTGGGSQLKHLKQLFEYITGLDTRIGYPNEHLAPSNLNSKLESPIFATGIGLMMRGFESIEKRSAVETQARTHSKKTKGSFFDKFIEKSKDVFLSNESDEY